MRFAVTSLSTGLPVAGARVQVEATLQSRGDTSWVTLAEGTTGPDGAYRFEAPGYSPTQHYTLRRIVVTKDEDVVAFDATRPPDRYADNQWSKSRETWLQWTVEELAGARHARAGARPPVHGAARLPAGGGGARQGLPPPPRRGSPRARDRRGLPGRRGSGRPRLALSGHPHRRGQLLPQVPGEGPPHRRLHRALRGQEEEPLRQRGLLGRGLPHPAVRGAAPRSGQDQPRPAVRGLPHRDLLRGRAGGRPAGALAGDPVPAELRPQEARGLPLQLRRALLGERTLRVDAPGGEGRRHEPRGRGEDRPRPDHRAHGRAAQLRGRGHGHRRRRPDRHRHPHHPGPAPLRPRPEGAALPRAREEPSTVRCSWPAPTASCWTAATSPCACCAASGTRT